MPFSPADFEKGIDFTALGPGATAGDHNSLVDNAVPYIDIEGQSGKAIILWSVDVALDIPDVPDASTETKWKNYIWMRIPFAVASNRIPALYVWDDSVASDPTYLKWVVFNDLSAIEALIDALDTRIDAVEVIVNNALATANSANSLAAQALAAAQNAVTTANAASEVATAADEKADEASANATTALNTAQSASNVANNALAATAFIPRYYGSQTVATFSINDHIAYDNSIPQSNEGVEILTLTFTPRAAGNRVYIRASVACAVDSGARGVLALFVNDDTSASAVATMVETTEDGYNMIVLDFFFAAVSVDPVVLRLRAGADSGTLTVGGARYGGVLRTYIQATEVPPVP